MMGRRVGVFKRNAVPGNVVIAIRESPKKDRSLAETNAVGVVTESAGRDLDDLGIIRGGWGVLTNVLAADLRPGYLRVERTLGERVLGGN